MNEPSYLSSGIFFSEEAVGVAGWLSAGAVCVDQETPAMGPLQIKKINK